jgi:hypothetical protein
MYESILFCLLQGVVGSEFSLKTAVVSLFVEGVLEIEGDEKGESWEVGREWVWFSVIPQVSKVVCRNYDIVKFLCKDSCQPLIKDLPVQ